MTLVPAPRRLAVALTLAVAACGTGAPPAADGPSVRIGVAPLTLAGVVDACYSLRVDNGASPPETVWERHGVCASAFGDGGSVSYVGPCDASAGAAHNTVTLTVDGLSGPDGPLSDWRDPCPGGCQLAFDCVANADVPVDFDVTILRQANQGFFDVAVNFGDVFCSAKADCETPSGDELDLLFRPDGTRDLTAVLALACTGGPGTPTQLYLDDVAVACSNPAYGAVVNPALGPGAVTPTRNDGPLLFAAAVYRGDEAADAAAYWNVALGVDEAAFAQAGTCHITARATAAAGPLPDFSIAPDRVYPVIAFDVPLAADGARTCHHHGLDRADGAVATTYTALGVGESFAYTYAEGDDGVVVPRGLAAPEVTTTPGRDAIHLAWDPVDGASGYHVARAADAAGPFVPIGTVDAPATTFDDPDLGPAASWFYVVTAFAPGIESPPPAPVPGTSAAALALSPDGGHILTDAHVTLHVTGAIGTPIIAITGDGHYQHSSFVAGSVDGEGTVTVSDDSGAIVVAHFTVVHACDPAASTWSTVLDPSAGYTAQTQSTPVGVGLTIDRGDDLLLATAAAEPDGNAWVTLRRTSADGTWSELDRFRNSYTTGTTIYGLYPRPDGGVMAFGSTAATGLDTLSQSGDGAAWTHATIGPLATYGGYTPGNDVFVASGAGTLYLASGGYEDSVNEIRPAGVLFTSGDGGAHWSELPRYRFGARDTHYRGVWVDSQGRLVVLAVAYDQPSNSFFDVVRVSDDGGQTFSDTSDALPTATEFVYGALVDDRTLVIAGGTVVYRRDPVAAGLTLLDSVSASDAWITSGLAVDGTTVYTAGFYNVSPYPNVRQHWWVRRGTVDGGFTTVDDYTDGTAYSRAYDVSVDSAGRVVVGGEDTTQTRAVVRVSGDQGGSWATYPLPADGGRVYLPWGRSAAADGLVATRGNVYHVDYGTGAVALVDQDFFELPSVNNAARVVAVDPSSDAIVVTGVFGSGASANGWGGGTRRSVDAGVTWSTIDQAPGSFEGVNFMSLLIDPVSDALLVGGFDGDDNQQSSPFVRRSDDGGGVWTEDTSTFQQDAAGVFLARDPTRGDDYAATSTSFPCAWVIRRSSDGGATWAPFDSVPSSDPFCFGSGHAPAAIAVAPSGDVWVVGSIQQDFNAQWAVRKWSAATQTWATVDQVSGGQARANSVAIDTRGNVYVGGNRQLRTSTDGGATWTQARSDGNYVALATAFDGTVYAASVPSATQGGALTVQQMTCVP